MTPLPWMPTYVKRWLTSEKVTAMTITQEGAFNRLLLLAWDNKDCTVPADRDTLKRLAKWNGYDDADFTIVFSCFVPHPTLPGRLFNEVEMDLWLKSQQLRADKVTSGKKGAAKRWHGGAMAKPRRKHSYYRTETDTDTNTKKKEKKAALVGVADQDWIGELKGDPAFVGLDVDHELAKALRWCKTKGRKCSRQFFVNWLNRAERPLQAGPGRGTGPARSIVELGTRKT